MMKHVRNLTLVPPHTYPNGSSSPETVPEHSASLHRNYGYASDLSKHFGTISGKLSSRRFRRGEVLVACVGIGVAAAMTGMATALNPAPPGLTVSPAQVSLVVSEAEPTAQTSVTVANGAATEAHVTAKLRAIDETGARLVPTGPLDASTAAALSISSADLTIPPRGEVAVEVSLRNSGALTPGGHYAALVLTQEYPGGGGSTFQPAVVVSVFAIKSDGVRRDLRLEKFRASHTVFTLPSEVTLTFQNKGNTHVVPRASVSFTDSRGRLVRQAVVNTESRLLFPGRTDHFRAPVRVNAPVVWPTRLTMRITYRIDGTDVYLHQSQTFFYVPLMSGMLVSGVGAAIWWQRRRLLRILLFARKNHRRALHGSTALKTDDRTGDNQAQHTAAHGADKRRWLRRTKKA